MKVVATSDLHGALPMLPECDLLVLAGDCIPGNVFTKNTFRRWLEKQPARHIVGIAGNHDHEAYNYRERITKLPWTYLQDETVDIEGVKIHGSPWTKKFFSGDVFSAEDDWLDTKWRLIPDDVDLLVTHGPPWGICDVVGTSEHAGSPSLRNVVQRRLDGPFVHVFGHIHEGRGEYRVDGRRFFNVSWVGRFFNTGHDGHWATFDIHPRPRRVEEPLTPNSGFGI